MGAGYYRRQGRLSARAARDRPGRCVRACVRMAGGCERALARPLCVCVPVPRQSIIYPSLAELAVGLRVIMDDPVRPTRPGVTPRGIAPPQPARRPALFRRSRGSRATPATPATSSGATAAASKPCPAPRPGPRRAGGAQPARFLRQPIRRQQPAVGPRVVFWARAKHGRPVVLHVCGVSRAVPVVQCGPAFLSSAG